MNEKELARLDKRAELMAVLAALAALVMIIISIISKHIEESKVIDLPVSTMSESEQEDFISMVWETVKNNPPAEEVISRMQESETQQPKHYELTEAERSLIEQVVSAECRGEPYDGQVAVAQCILNACLKDDIRPAQAIKKYDYTSNRATPTDSVKKAVSAVFDNGEGVTDEPILYYYAPKRTSSEWHESQIFVIEIANHRFFKEA